MNQLTHNILLNRKTNLLRQKQDRYQMVDWLSFFLFSIFYMALWHPPGIPLPTMNIAVVLALGGSIFILQGKTLNNTNLKLFWAVCLTSFLGAFLSLTRAMHFSEAAWNTIAFLVNIFGFVFFLPILVKAKTRKMLLILHIVIAILWAFEIQKLVDTYGVLRYWTFGFTGNNKNHIGICLAIGSVAAFYFSLFYPFKRSSIFWNNLLKIVFGCIAIFIFYNLTLIFARSSLLSAICGILFTLFLLISKSKGKNGLLKLFVILVGLTSLTLIAIPKILATSSAWNALATQEDKTNREGNTYDDRITILKKGLYLVKQNPILGVGIGGGRHKITDEETGQFFRTSLMHNSYLADWVDRGFLGLLSNIIWIIGYFIFARKHLIRLIAFDQVWVIICAMTFFSMLFKDLGTLSMTMLTLLAAIIYSQKRLINFLKQK